MAQARASVGVARVDLEHTTIRAPISGTVLQRAVDVGQTVAASLQAPVLFTIAQDLSRMEVHAAIDEADVGKLHEGQEATFTVDAYPGETFHGDASSRSARSRPSRRTWSPTTPSCASTTRTGSCGPGMTATVRVGLAAARGRAARAELGAALPAGARADREGAGAAGRGGGAGGGGRRDRRGGAGAGGGRRRRAAARRRRRRRRAAGAGRRARASTRPQGDKVVAGALQARHRRRRVHRGRTGGLHEGDEVVVDVDGRHAAAPRARPPGGGNARPRPRFF